MKPAVLQISPVIQNLPRDIFSTDPNWPGKINSLLDPSKQKSFACV